MKDYEISKETLAVMPIGEKKSKVIEKDCSFIINQTPNHIMDDSCRYYGSSINGRQKGTTDLTGISYKAPIIVQEAKSKPVEETGFSRQVLIAHNEETYSAPPKTEAKEG